MDVVLERLYYVSEHNTRQRNNETFHRQIKKKKLYNLNNLYK